eukprot:350946-Chlamydomonas_euryale.AAC.1
MLLLLLLRLMLGLQPRLGCATQLHAVVHKLLRHLLGVLPARRGGAATQPVAVGREPATLLRSSSPGARGGRASVAGWPGSEVQIK